MLSFFSGFRDKNLESKIVQEGGEIVDTISKKCTILIVKELNSSSSKIVKAQKMGIKIMKKDDVKMV